MSELKQFEQISDEQSQKVGVVNLADRPNQKATFGEGGLSSAELKARFDRLPNEIRAKLNALFTTLTSSDATQYIAMPTGTEENPLPAGWAQKYQNVSDFILAFASGEISEDLVVISNEGSFSLKTAINKLFNATNSNKEDISELKSLTNSIYEAIRIKQDKLIAGEGIVISGNVISAPGQSDTAGTIVLIDNNFAKEVSFTSDPQTQIDGKADKTQLDEKADKDNVDAVTRIDVSALPTDSYPLSAMITAKIQQAVAIKPIGASRANIEFYNVPATDETGSYEYWNDVDFFSNCNYFFSDMDDVSSAKYFNLENLKNCNFEGFNIGSTEDLGLVFSNCENIQILNSTIKSLSARPLRFENCNELYFENCVFERSSYPFDYEITFTDNGSGFRWIMFDNCIFSKHEGMIPFNASGVTNAKNLITFSGCHFDDLSKVSKADFSVVGSGKIVVLATEDDIPTVVSQLENDAQFATKSEIPTKVSALENDEGFAKKSDLSTVYRYKGSVNNFSDLARMEVEKLEIGDTYNVLNTVDSDVYGHYPKGTNFAYNGAYWDALGGEVDLTNYVQKSDLATQTTDGLLSGEDKAKLDSVEDRANNYTLPKATGSMLGGIIVGDNLAIDNTTGILRGNYPLSSTTNEGLMSIDQAYALHWMYGNLGTVIHKYGEFGWEGPYPNTIKGCVTYTRTGMKRGLLSFSFVLTKENVSEPADVPERINKWLISISKVENLLGVQFKRGTDPDDETTWIYGGNWCRQGDEITQTGPHYKARTCCITPYAFLPCLYAANGEDEDGNEKVKIATVGTASFKENGIVQMWDIPVEEK